MTDLMITITVASALGFWFLLSVLQQINHGSITFPFERYDCFAVIPIYTFFAPFPAVFDYNILYRDALANGTLTPWRTLDSLVQIGLNSSTVQAASTLP
jgi:hypothetical protein